MRQTSAPLYRPFGSRASRLRCLGVAVLLASCEPATAPVPLHPGDLHRHVTATLARDLSPDGRLVLANPESRAYPQISPERASELAVAFARTLGPSIRGYLEGDHGRAIDFDALRVGSPAYYAAPPYDPVPPNASAGLRNAYGPYYLVYLVDPSGTPVVTLSIASHTEAAVVDGRIVFPRAYGNDFVAHGVPVGEGFSMPPSPEQAVRIASLATGARVAAVPELMLGSREYHPVHARWKMTLDRPVQARVGGVGAQTVRTSTVYVGLRGETFVPAPEQPERETVALDPSRSESFQLPRHPRRPMVFDRARFSNE